MIEHKSFDVECKGIDEDSGMVELYAAVFSNVDRAGERIEPGAFKNIDEFKRSGWLAINHDWGRLGVATIEDARQDEKGLRIRAHFHSTPEAQAVRTTIRERIDRAKSVKASIGYRVLDDAKVDVDGKSIRSLKAIDLYEASIVNMPANPSADVMQAKSLMTLDEFGSLIQEFKEGRVLSTANRAMTAAWRAKLMSILAELDDLLDMTEPKTDNPPDATGQPVPHPATQPNVPKSLLPAFLDLNREFLATSARFDR